MISWAGVLAVQRRTLFQMPLPPVQGMAASVGRVLLKVTFSTVLKLPLSNDTPNSAFSNTTLRTQLWAVP
jgi:hypothetical protein